MAGLIPRKYRDNRRYSFHRTFGSTTELVPCDFDISLSNFNQNIPNPITGEPAYPNGCTAFTRADIATNEDKIIYKPGFTYEKSCYMANVPIGESLPLETSFKSGIVYGLQALGETTDTQALAHRRGPYFEVHPKIGQDYFDAIWSALLIGKKGISIGTPWFPELSRAGIVDNIQIRPTDDWHDYEGIGVQLVNGQPYLKVKWWSGPPKLFSRITVNTLCSVKGTDLLTDVNGKAMPQDIQNIRLDLFQLLLSYYYRLLKALQNPPQQPVSSPPVAPVLPQDVTSVPNPPSMPTTPKKDMLTTFCTAIEDFEGGPNDLNHRNNNPGNFRCSPVGYLTKYGDVRCVGNFAVFPTFEQGWEYLEASVLHWATLHPTWTIYDFFLHYAPPLDNNPTLTYASNIAAKCGVPVSTMLKDLFA